MLNNSRQMETPSLSELFRPHSIAVVGASENPSKQGYRFARNLIEFGFAGPIYLVNPNYTEILGLPCYRDVASLPLKVDYVISCIPAAASLSLIEQCAWKGVKLVHLYTARFSETGRRAASNLEEELREQSLKLKIRILGPNCVGLYDPEVGISFKYNLPRQPGQVAVLSQSGSIAVHTVSRGGIRGLRFTQAVNYGNGVDINESDLMVHFCTDSRTKVIGAYVEGVKDGKRFLDTLKETARQKPVILLKGGCTSSGSKVTLSHTASVAGSHQMWTAALKQSGVIEADHPEEMIDFLLAFALLPPARGLRVGIAGGGGGLMVLSADACEKQGLVVEPIPQDMRAWLKQSAPDVWDWVTNPVDASIMRAGVRAEDVLKQMALSDNFDLLVGISDDGGASDPLEEQKRLKEAVDSWIGLRKMTNKPMVAILGTAESPEEWRWRNVLAAQQQLADAGIPSYPSAHRAMRALSCFAHFCANFKRESL